MWEHSELIDILDLQFSQDHLVAELYKHMEDRGQPINRTPNIANKDVDLYRLFKIVYKLGGHSRVSTNNLWRQVAMKLGFETAWCANQVRYISLPPIQGNLC